MDTSRVPANGCVVSSKVIPQVQLVVSPGAVEENASLGLQVWFQIDIPISYFCHTK